MFTHALLLAAALVPLSASPVHIPLRTCAILAAVGGPLRISLADKDKGDITKAEWAGIRSIALHGCMPDWRISSVRISISDCSGKEVSVSSSDATLTPEMRTMIANLPAGTPFYVEAKVGDGKGKNWQVPTAKFIWKG